MASSSDTIVLLGATGQLGHDIEKIAFTLDMHLIPLGHENVDITILDSVKHALTEAKPTVIINCAAFHQVERCEEDPREAFSVNALGALNVARSATSLGARCVYVSTDYVFPGDKPAPGGEFAADTNSYVETDMPRPINVYGASKLAGENLTIMTNPRALVVRTASLFGVAGSRGKGGNFIETILRKARDGSPVNVVNDQYMTPTYTMDAAKAILRLALMNVAWVVHVTNRGACTWYDLAAKAIKLVGLDANLQPVSTSTYSSRTKRPANSALSTGLVESLLGEPMRSWEDALRAYLKEKGYL